MTNDPIAAHSDEQSRYLAILNGLKEISFAFETLHVPADAKTKLEALMRCCLADFEARFAQRPRRAQSDDRV